MLQVAKNITRSSKLIGNLSYTYWTQLQLCNTDIHEFFFFVVEISF